MLGKTGILGILVILAFTTGCTMCCHPYDECGPVFDEGSGHSYCSNVRAGSILEGQAAPAASQEVIEEQPESVSAAPPLYPSTDQLSTVGEPQKLSVLDEPPRRTAAAAKRPTTRSAVKQAGDSTNSKVRRW